MKFFTYSLMSLFSHVFSEFSTIAIHAEEEACETGSRLLLLQKKAGNNWWLTITEYLNGKAVLETKEQLEYSTSIVQKATTLFAIYSVNLFGSINFLFNFAQKFLYSRKFKQSL